MSDKIIGNYLSIYRRRSGLSQRELGIIVGYDNQWQIGRHEQSRAVPPLLVALAYEAVFRVPVSAIFVGFQLSIASVIEENLTALKRNLEGRPDGRRAPQATMQKLQWLEGRLNRS